MENLRIQTAEVASAYFDEDALRLAPARLYRLDGAGRRLYFTVEPDDAGDPEVEFYVSVTSIIKETTPTSPYLIEWIASKGDGAEEAKNERAAYGTLMHILFEDVLNARVVGGTFNLNGIPDVVAEYLAENPTPGADPLRYAVDLRRDVLAFALWTEEYDVKPIAIEIPLKSEVFKVAGTADLFCKLTVQEYADRGEVYKSGPRKGEPKLTKGPAETYALIDFKSTRKNVYLEHEIQLAYYRELFVENFPEFADKDIRLFNLRMKNWISKPDVTLTNQTGKHTVRELELRRDLFFENNDITSGDKTLIGGEIDFGAPVVASDFFDRVSLTDYVLGRIPANFLENEL